MLTTMMRESSGRVVCRVSDAGNEAVVSAADAVLVMGPLYHLPSRDDRIATLHEAMRVLAPGGLLFDNDLSDSCAAPSLRFDPSLQEHSHRLSAEGASLPSVKP